MPVALTNPAVHMRSAKTGKSPSRASSRAFSLLCHRPGLVSGELDSFAVSTPLSFEMCHRGHCRMTNMHRGENMMSDSSLYSVALGLS